MTTPSITYGELHQRISALVSQGSARSLADFLEAVWCEASRHRELTPLPLATFIAILETAFHEPARVRDLPSAVPLGAYDPALTGYARFEQAIRSQLRDLREMAAAGTLHREDRYFGVDSPRGSRWYNFVPATYLECGLTGTFGAYADEEPTPDDDPFDWDTFAFFLLDGQQYE